MMERAAAQSAARQGADGCRPGRQSRRAGLLQIRQLRGSRPSTKSSAAIGLAGGRLVATIVLPIGLSFYVLQSVSYLVDIRRGHVPVSRSFLNYAAYKAIFSQLIAGPIVRYAEIADELKQPPSLPGAVRPGGAHVHGGLRHEGRIADTLSPMVDAAFPLSPPTLADAWLAAVTYTLQLYFDFAGYSLDGDRAGADDRLPLPARTSTTLTCAGSIQDFWQRWHMTLSRFLRDYLYIPLGGNRAGPGGPM